MGFFRKLWHPGFTENRPIALVISSNETVRTQLRELLSKIGWETLTANGCEGGLATLNRSRMAAVFCDRDLPGCDWRREMKRLTQTSYPAPIILISSVADSYLLEEVIRHGGYDVLPKPFQEQELLQVIHFVRKAGPSASQPMK